MRDSFSFVNFSQVTEGATLGISRSQNWIASRVEEESFLGGSFSKVNLGVDFI